MGVVIDERLAKARHKCFKLQKVDTDIEKQKVYPTALYGAPMAVLSGKHSGNNALCLAFVIDALADPEIFYATVALREARQYLLHATEAEQAAFYSIVAQPPHSQGQVRGPAGVLGSILNRFHWTCSVRGDICTTACHAFSLTKVSFAYVQSQLRAT